MHSWAVCRWCRDVSGNCQYVRCYKITRCFWYYTWIPVNTIPKTQVTRNGYAEITTLHTAWQSRTVNRIFNIKQANKCNVLTVGRSNVMWHCPVWTIACGCRSPAVAVIDFFAAKRRSTDSQCFSMDQTTPRIYPFPVGISSPSDTLFLVPKCTLQSASLSVHPFLSAHWLCGDVQLSNITFLNFCCFVCHIATYFFRNWNIQLHILYFWDVLNTWA